MSRVKNPREKKALSYALDRVSGAEYPHAARRARPRLKALHHRVRRSQNRALLAAVVNRDDFESDAIGSHDHAPVTHVKWCDSVPLGADVAERLEKREVRIAWNYFKEPYCPHCHRERFVRFLEHLVAGGFGRPRGFAQKLAEMLDHVGQDEPRVKPSDRHHYDPWSVSAHSAWLRCFLEDQPGWDGPLRDWVDAVLGTR